MFTISIQLLSGLTIVIEEKIYKTYDVHPLKLLGLEGIFEIPLSILMLVLFQHIKCSSCQFGLFEDSLEALNQINLYPLIGVMLGV